MEFSFREAKPDDALLIRDFQIAMAYESEKLRLDPDTCFRGVKRIFAEPSIGTYHVVEAAHEVVACVLVQREWSDWRARMIGWIHSLYVRPDYRGRGITRRIYASLQERVRHDPDLGGLRLYVDRTNEIAIQVYERLGMTREHYHLYEWMKS